MNVGGTWVLAQRLNEYKGESQLNTTFIDLYFLVKGTM